MHFGPRQTGRPRERGDDLRRHEAGFVLDRVKDR
jgi:hypothetical protein